MTTQEKQAVTELAETVKEIVRILQCLHSEKAIEISEHLSSRLEAVYKKATLAKNRVDL